MKYEPACFCEMKQQVLLVSCACFKDSSAPFVRWPPQHSPSERLENPSLSEKKRYEGVSVGGCGGKNESLSKITCFYDLLHKHTQTTETQCVKMQHSDAYNKLCLLDACVCAFVRVLIVMRA